MRVNHNISAIKANSILRRTNNLLDRSTEKLSSGLRINKAADDAAGMAISQKMHTQIAGLDQASRNASDGISVIQTAEGALNEVEGMLQRIRELSVQAANDSNTTADRAAIQTEINSLMTEINRISSDTEFNTKSLLDGNVDRKSYSSSSAVEIISISDNVPITDYQVNVLQDARQAVLTGFAFGSEGEEVGANGTIKINGYDIAVREEMTYDELYDSIRSACDLMNIQVFPDGGVDMDEGTPETGYYVPAELGDGDLVFVTGEYGSTKQIEIFCSEELQGIFGVAEEGAMATGVDAQVEIIRETDESGFTNTATVSVNGNIVTISDRDSFEMKLKIIPGKADTVFTDASVDGSEADVTQGGGITDVILTVLDAGPMELQVGANENQTMIVTVPKIDTETLEISGLNVTTTVGAQEAITLADNAIELVSTARAKLGAYQNRLEHTVSNLDTSSLSITEALSRIEDVDMAEEMTTYTQKNVLSQAGTAMLAQANERPQTILTLIQG